MKEIDFDNFLAVESEEVDEYTLFWRKVIDKAIDDSCMIAPRDTIDVLAKQKAIVWLSTDSPDFRDVCSMANKRPEDVRAKAKQRWKELPEEIEV